MAYFIVIKGTRHDIPFNAKHVLADIETGEILATANSRQELATVRTILGRTAKDSVGTTVHSDEKFEAAAEAARNNNTPSQANLIRLAIAHENLNSRRR